MREDKKPWLWIILAGAILCACGCGGYRPGGANAAPSPTATVEPSVHSEGDVQQTLNTIQETLTEVKNANASAQTEADGTFELAGLSTGNHNVTVEARGEYATITEPNVGAGTEGLTITVGRAQVIEGVVYTLRS